jgi:hypothetical protein
VIGETNDCGEPAVVLVPSATREQSPAVCALWFYRNGHPDYDLCETEDEAALLAVVMADDAMACPVGVQFASGRTVPLAEWAAFTQARERFYADQIEQRARLLERRAEPVRTVRSPFGDEPVEVPADDPPWLGRPIG